MIAVTGASGLTGGFTIEALQNQGFADRIRCMIRPQSDLTSIQDNPCVDLVMGDCLDLNSIRNLVRGCDCLIHIAGILYAEHVIEACTEAGLERVVFVNTTGMYSRYRKYSSEYMRMESLIMSSGLQYTIIRPTMIYGGAKDHNIRRLVRFIDRHYFVPVIAGGKALLQPIYAKDLANVIAVCTLGAQTIGRDYNVAGKKPIAHADMLKIIAQALGKKRVFVTVPYWTAYLAGCLGELVPRSFITIERIQRVVENKAFDYSRAADELGFEPIGFEEGIQYEIRDLRKHGLVS